MVLTNWKIIVNLDGITRQMKKQTPLNSKQRKGNHAHTHSNVQTVREITKLTQINVHSGGINSTGNGSRKNMLRSMKTGSNQFALWGVVNVKNDFTKPQNIFAKCPKKFTHHQCHTQDSKAIQYHPHPETSLV